MKQVEIISLIILGLLLFLMPLPRSISLRDLLLFLVLVCCAYLAWRRAGGIDIALRDMALPVGILVALTTWMYGVAFFISAETSWSLEEIHSQWFRGLASFAAGMLAATVARQSADFGKKATLALFIALLAHVVYVDAMAFYQWSPTLIHGGDFKRISGLAGGSDKSNYVTNALFCFLFAEALSRRLYAKNFLEIDNKALWTAFALTFLSMFAERMRNGVIVFVLLLVLTALFYLQAQKNRARKMALRANILGVLFMVIGGLVLAIFIKPVSNPVSVGNLLGTAVIAWDTEKYKAWQDEPKYGLPKLPNGDTVDGSLYQRVAWFKEGLLLIKDNPLGVGFGRNAFGHGLKAKYGVGRGHSHSGMLDFTIGVGIPGMLLWLGFFVSLVLIAYKRYRASHHPATLLLIFLLFDFGARMFLDSVIRDHMLQQFMLLVGFSGILMMTKTVKQAKSSA